MTRARDWEWLITSSRVEMATFWRKQSVTQQLTVMRDLSHDGQLQSPAPAKKPDRQTHVNMARHVQILRHPEIHRSGGQQCDNNLLVVTWLSVTIQGQRT